MEDNKLIIYKNSDGDINVDAIYKDETLWLSQKGMSKVFECSTDNISLHLKHIFEEKELAYKEYDKFKVKQDKLYKSDFDNFLNETRMIENGSDK